MPDTNVLNRREFIKTGVTGGGALVLGFSLSERAVTKGAEISEPSVFKPNAWVRITSDNRVTIIVEKPEIGQGARTALPMILAEEMEVDWSTIRVEQAPTLPEIYQGLNTGGSDGTPSSWMPLRKVGAQAREMLLTAAAQRWSVGKNECRAQSGTVVHVPSKRRLTYGQLVDIASKIPDFKTDNLPLKDPKDFRFIGKPIPRTDVPSKVDGSAIFGLDVRIPGMLYAVIARCPHFGGTLVNFDATQAKAAPGVHAVFPVSPLGFLPKLGRNINTAGGVAVVANTTWAAIQGRNLLKLSWDKGPYGHERHR